jgi:hypothetical protein
MGDISPEELKEVQESFALTYGVELFFDQQPKIDRDLLLSMVWIRAIELSERGSRFGSGGSRCAVACAGIVRMCYQWAEIEFGGQD